VDVQSWQADQDAEDEKKQLEGSDWLGQPH